MPTNVPTSWEIDNVKNAEIWPVKFLMFYVKRVYLSCPSSDFNDQNISSGCALFKIKEILKIKQ